jgi:hypothetical protein
VSSTEADVQCNIRGDCTLRNWYIFVHTNARSTDSTFTLRKGGADTALTFTVPASTTGLFTDTTNSVSITSGDAVNIKIVTGTGTGIISLLASFFAMDTTGQSFTHFGGANVGQSFSSNSTTYVMGLNNPTWLTSGSNNARSLTPIMESATFSKLQVYVTANARTTTTTGIFRKNSASGNMSVSIGSSATGLFEDTSNTDTVVATDVVSYGAVSSTGGGTITFSMFAVKYVGSTARRVALIAGVGTNLSVGATNYYSINGVSGASFTAEDDAISTMPLGGTISNAAVYIYANTSTTTVTFVMRKNAVDTAISIAVSASATGSFTDTTNSFDVAEADEVSWKGSGGTTNNINISSLTCLFTGAVAGAAKSSILFVFL